MEIIELTKKLSNELEKGQTVDGLIDYILCDFTMTNTIITKYHGVFNNIRRSTQKRLIKQFIDEVV